MAHSEITHIGCFSLKGEGEWQMLWLSVTERGMSRGAFGYHFAGGVFGPFEPPGCPSGPTDTPTACSVGMESSPWGSAAPCLLSSPICTPGCRTPIYPLWVLLALGFGFTFFSNAWTLKRPGVLCCRIWILSAHTVQSFLSPSVPTLFSLKSRSFSKGNKGHFFSRRYNRNSKPIFPFLPA